MKTSDRTKHDFLESYRNLDDWIKYVIFIPEKFYTLHNRIERVIDEFEDKESKYFNQVSSRYIQRMRAINILLPISSVIKYEPQSFAIVVDLIDDLKKEKVFRDLNEDERDKYFLSFNPLNILRQLVDRNTFNNIIQELNITYRNNYSVLLLALNDEARDIYQKVIAKYEGLELYEDGSVKNAEGIKITLNGTHLDFIIDIVKSNKMDKPFKLQSNRYKGSNVRDLYQNINNRIKILGFKISKARKKLQYRLIPLSS